MKYLLLLALLGVVWWVWKKRSAEPTKASRSAPPPEKMVACAHCGLLLPESDSVAVGDAYFCSEAHRRAAETGRQ